MSEERVPVGMKNTAEGMKNTAEGMKNTVRYGTHTLSFPEGGEFACGCRFREELADRLGAFRLGDAGRVLDLGATRTLETYQQILKRTGGYALAEDWRKVASDFWWALSAIEEVRRRLPD